MPHTDNKPRPPLIRRPLSLPPACASQAVFGARARLGRFLGCHLGPLLQTLHVLLARRPPAVRVNGLLTVGRELVLPVARAALLLAYRVLLVLLVVFGRLCIGNLALPVRCCCCRWPGAPTAPSAYLGRRGERPPGTVEEASTYLWMTLSNGDQRCSSRSSRPGRQQACGRRTPRRRRVRGQPWATWSSPNRSAARAARTALKEARPGTASTFLATSFPVGTSRIVGRCRGSQKMECRRQKERHKREVWLPAQCKQSEVGGTDLYKRPSFPTSARLPGSITWRYVTLPMIWRQLASGDSTDFTHSPFSAGSR